MQLANFGTRMMSSQPLPTQLVHSAVVASRETTMTSPGIVSWRTIGDLVSMALNLVLPSTLSILMLIVLGCCIQKGLSPFALVAPRPLKACPGCYVQKNRSHGEMSCQCHHSKLCSAASLGLLLHHTSYLTMGSRICGTETHCPQRTEGACTAALIPGGAEDCGLGMPTTE